MLINELRKKRADAIGKMDALLQLTDKEGREFNSDEEKSFAALEAEVAGLDQQIAAQEKHDARKAKVASAKTDLSKVNKTQGEKADVVITAGGDKNDSGFRNFGEFIHTIKYNPFDNRLAEGRVQQMKDGTAGGFAIPEQFRPQLLSVTPQQAIIRPRALVIPAGSPPDAKLSMPCLDQTASQNMFGGILMLNQGESDSITESTMRLKQAQLLPKKINGFVTASNELLNNWDAASAVIPQMMRNAMMAKEDTDFFSGNGVNKALGVINSPAAITVNRAGANGVTFADVTNMYARLRFGGSPVWIVSQTTIPQLVTIRDASSQSIWINSVANNLPPSLYGIPVLFNDRSPALGSKGDVVLADLSYYMIKDGSGPFVAVSDHFRFQNDEVAFRLTWHVDGQSWLSAPLVLEGATANTISPFVVLDIP